MDEESLELIEQDIKKPSKCKIFCLMCSCINKKGIWYTKFGKFIFWLPLFLLFAAIGFGLLMLFGLATMKVIYGQYDINNGCLFVDHNCTIPTLCHMNDINSLTLGCAAIGSISVSILFVSILVIMVIVGGMFHCFDSCCNELNKSYDHSKFSLERKMMQSNGINL